MSMTIIPFEEGEANLDWHGLCDAFEAGHKLPKAEMEPGQWREMRAYLAPQYDAMTRMLGRVPDAWDKEV